MSGPPPKRSDQRRRRNAPTWIDRVHAGSRSAAPDEPPRTGKGSGIKAWREYAASTGLEVPDGATRAEIMTMVDEGASAESSWHPLARDWYRSLAESGQSAFYEPSDWQTARVLAELLSRALQRGRVTAALIERWQAGATDLLTTEGARRRARLELQRAEEPEAGEDGADVSELDEWREKLRSSG